MPPKKDGVATNDGKKVARKRNKPRKKKDDCPSRMRKTDRVVLNKQARHIIAKVYDFMKKEATAEYAEKLTNARWRTATAVGVSEKTVSRILKDRKRSLADGSAVSGADAILHGKVQSVKDAEKSVGDLFSGNVTGAVQNLAGAAGDCLGGDIAALNAVTFGAASAAGQIAATKLETTSGLIGTGVKATGEVIGGKLAAAHNIATGLNDLASGNFTAAANSFSNAVGSVAAGDAEALGTLINGTFDAFGR